MIGIYKITNKINQKVYVGQSIHMEARWQQHKREALGDRSNTKLYQAMREYGIDNFVFEIIEQCLEKELNEKEQYWISFYDSFQNGYNSNKGGLGEIFDRSEIFKLWDDGKSIKEILEITRIKSKETIRSYLAGYKNYSVEESNRRGGIQARKTAIQNNNVVNTNYYSIIYQYSLKGEYIKQWNSTKEIQRELNIDGESVGYCLRGIRRTAGNFQWSLEKATMPDLSNNKQGRATKIDQLTLNDEFIKTYNTIAEAAKDNAVDPSLLSKVCKGKRKSAGGFHWRYSDN